MRKDQNILDDGMLKGGSTLGWNDEEMLWVGESKGLLEYNTEKIGEDSAMFQLFGMKPHSLLIALVPFFFGVFVLVSTFGILATAIIGAGALFYILAGRLHSKVIRYGLSEFHVFFEKKNLLGRRCVYLMNIQDIAKVHVERNENGTSSLHLITSIDPGFSTYEFNRGGKRPFPTLEFLAKPKRPLQLINERIRSRKRK